MRTSPSDQRIVITLEGMIAGGAFGLNTPGEQIDLETLAEVAIDNIQGETKDGVSRDEAVDATVPTPDDFARVISSGLVSGIVYDAETGNVRST